MTKRSVGAVWEGGMRCTVDAGGFPLVVDEPPEAGGTGQGPQPTELLLGAIASCFTLALAHSAAKRGIALRGLSVDATGTYDGPRFTAVEIAVRAEAPRGEELARLATVAERVCYVTNTLRGNPPIAITTT
ncbi:OsmC family protein [Actinomycetospora lutea]|uniref:OsmC family protein n=1 Tax=Actinomycetospora lutea TaxID=663604 RepID=UPI002366117B|nr:OsmC family protein [Actinomycetospora lutea]MDD7938299.1 OsmC family protein [Actinomycetospora lutea]